MASSCTSSSSRLSVLSPVTAEYTASSTTSLVSGCTNPRRSIPLRIKWDGYFPLPDVSTIHDLCRMQPMQLIIRLWSLQRGAGNPCAKLPRNVAEHVFSYLSMRDLGRQSAVCRISKTVADAAPIWRQFAGVPSNSAKNSCKSKLFLKLMEAEWEKSRNLFSRFYGLDEDGLHAVIRLRLLNESDIGGIERIRELCRSFQTNRILLWGNAWLKSLAKGCLFSEGYNDRYILNQLERHFTDQRIAIERAHLDAVEQEVQQEIQQEVQLEVEMEQ